ncbi:hypothetical protein JHK85_010388 [Glycine max]|nr:hypothetical protein JHK85_010388 [Glycine max]
MAARTGPSTSCILFAIVLPSFLLRITILAALRMGDKLDQDWLEEKPKQEMKALMELEKYDDDDSDDGDTEEDNMETNSLITVHSKTPTKSVAKQSLNRGCD